MSWFWVVPVARNATRWSSTFAMVQRHLRLQPFLNAGDWPEAIELLLNLIEHAAVVAFMPQLNHWSSVSTMLQGDNITMLQVRNFFDDLIEQNN